MNAWQTSVINKILGWQLGISFFAAVVFAKLSGLEHAISAAVGGLAGFIPSCLFAYMVKKATDINPANLLQRFYLAEATKWVLTAGLFLIIFQFHNIKIIPLLTGYVAVLSIFWFALLMR